MPSKTKMVTFESLKGLHPSFLFYPINIRLFYVNS